jgi:hypothetical protein
MPVGFAKAPKYTIRAPLRQSQASAVSGLACPTIPGRSGVVGDVDNQPAAAIKAHIACGRFEFSNRVGIALNALGYTTDPRLISQCAPRWIMSVRPLGLPSRRLDSAKTEVTVSSALAANFRQLHGFLQAGFRRPRRTCQADAAGC